MMKKMLLKLKSLVQSNRGDGEAVSFLVTTMLLMLVFCTLMYGFIYMASYFNTAAVAKFIVQDVAGSGRYNTSEVRDLARDMMNKNLEFNASSTSDLQVTSNSSIFTKSLKSGEGHPIQHLDSFKVEINARYKIKIFNFTDTPVEVPLKIHVTAMGVSRVFWKSGEYA